MVPVDFSFKTWLEQGAIIGKVGKWAEVHWGKPIPFSQETLTTGPAFFHTTFFHENTAPWLQYPHHKRFAWREWKALVSEELKQYVVKEEPETEWEEPSEAAFKKVFQEIKKEIKNKKIQKAVPVVTAQAPKLVTPALAILRALKMSPVNTYVYGRWQKDEGFFGFSPEVLFVRESKNAIKTMALAGTRKKEHYLQDPEDFLRDPKEVKEHQYVVDDIVQRLKSFGKEKVGKTSFLELNYLTHLYTPIQVVCPAETSFEQMIEVLHPTPALGIVPREQMGLLKNWRNKSDILGSPFGVRWTAKEFLCLVAIRKIQWNATHYFIGNGCGIVEESQFAEEWQELRTKRDSVRKTFQL